MKKEGHPGHPSFQHPMPRRVSTILNYLIYIEYKSRSCGGPIHATSFQAIRPELKELGSIELPLHEPRILRTFLESNYSILIATWLTKVMSRSGP